MMCVSISGAGFSRVKVNNQNHHIYTAVHGKPKESVSTGSVYMMYRASGMEKRDCGAYSVMSLLGPGLYVRYE